MKKNISLALALTLSFSVALPSYSLHADKPYTAAAQREASAHVEAVADETAVIFLDGNYQLDEYEASVSESYVNNFLAEVKKVPALGEFNFTQYETIAPQIMFFPRSVMMFRDGYAYNGRIMINLGTNLTTLDRYKQVAAHELFHLGTNGLGVEWLEEAFAVLFTQRVDEVYNREMFAFTDSAAGRNDLRIGELLSQLIGGEDKLATMAWERDSCALVAEAFDAAQEYVSFADFSFANISIRYDNEDENFLKNIEYLEYMVKNPKPAKGDKMREEIRAFYMMPSREAAEKFSAGINALSNGYETPSQTLDYFTRRVMSSSSADIFYPGEGDLPAVMEDAALLLAYEYTTPALREAEGSFKFLWAEAAAAVRLYRFEKEHELSVSARSVMRDVSSYALSGELLETVFGPENIANLNSFPYCVNAALPEMRRIFTQRTGKEMDMLLADGTAGPVPAFEMLRQIIDICFVQPVKDGVLGREQAAQELNGFRQKNYEVLEGRMLLETVDAALAEIGK